MNAVMDHTTVTVWHKPSELIIMWYIIDLLSGNSISVCKGQGRPLSAGRAFSEWVAILSHLPRVFGQVLTNWSMHVCVLLCNVSETEVSFHPLRIPADPVQNGSFIHFFESVPGHIHTIHIRTVWHCWRKPERLERCCEKMQISYRKAQESNPSSFCCEATVSSTNPLDFASSSHTHLFVPRLHLEWTLYYTFVIRTPGLPDEREGHECPCHTLRWTASVFWLLSSCQTVKYLPRQISDHPTEPGSLAVVRTWQKMKDSLCVSDPSVLP